MTLSDTARHRRLKKASADLSTDVGGIEAAAELCGKSKSVVGRNVTAHDEYYFNLRDAAELERYASKPFVTAEMARLAGGVFVPLPESTIDGSGLREGVLAIAEELGDVSQATRDALKDMVVDPREGDTIVRELTELIEAAVHTRAMVQAMVEGKPVAPVKEAVNG